MALLPIRTPPELSPPHGGSGRRCRSDCSLERVNDKEVHSVHTGGALVGLDDGSVKFLTANTHIVVELQGEKGKRYTIRQAGEKGDGADPGTLSVPAGESKTLTLHTCHSLPEVGEPGEKVTFTARMKCDGRTIESAPLTVK